MNSVRVASHVHSSWSYDAEWSLQDIAAAFRRRGYDAILMSEHDRSFTHERWLEYQRACEEASSDDILLVPGIEYEDTDNVVHTPVWGIDIPFLGAARPTLDLLRSASSEGAVAVLAHPWRRNAIARYDPQWAPMLTAIEIWNRKYDGVAPHPRSNEVMRQHGLRPIVALDFHTSRQFFPLALSITLDAAPSASSLLHALRLGRFKPEFLGVSALRFTGGVEGAALRALETVRRGVRKPLRMVLPDR
jgi:hypothetical protein